MLRTRHGTIHVTHYKLHGRMRTEAMFFKNFTPAQIKDHFGGPSPQNSFVGVAKVDTRDRFVRRVGRKKAIKDALLKAHCDKKTRTEIWEDLIHGYAGTRINL